MTTFHLNQKIDRVILYQGKTYRYFSGTAYLGMSMLPEFENLVVEGMRRFGLTHGQSRGNNVRLRIFEEFEEFFADKAGAEAVTVMSSGYLAGSAALQVSAQDTDQIWIAPDTHPAILPENLSPDPLQSFEDWRSACLEKSERLAPQKILILGNAVDPLSSRIHQYDWLAEIGTRHELTLLIDDSHAFGVVGNGIFGTYDSLKMLPSRLIVSGSLGKGLGLAAGIILSDAKVKSQITNLRIFGGASPCPPGYLHAFLEGQSLYHSQKQKLSTALSYFARKVKNLPELIGSENYPVFIYSKDEWVANLENQGVITSSFHYPRASDPRINRIVISAFHQAEDLDLLSDLLIKFSSST